MRSLQAINFGRIEDVPDPVWQDLSAPDNIFVSRSWSLTLRRSNPDISIDLWAVRDAEGWLLAVPVHLLDGAPARSTYNVWALHEGEIGADDAQPLPTDREHLLIGTRNGQGNGFLRAPHRPIPADAAAALLNAIADAHQCAVISMLYLSLPQIREIGAELAGWHRRFVDVAGYFHVPPDCPNLDEFITTTDKGTRRRVRAELRAAGETRPVHVDDPESIRELVPSLAPLLVNVQNRHGQPSSTASMESYLRACAQDTLNPHVFLAGGPDGPRAFSLCIVQDGFMSVRVVGLDYESIANDQPDYAMVSIYEPLRLAMSLHLRGIDLGVGTLQAKMLRGASAEPLFSLMRFPQDRGARLLHNTNKARIARVIEATGRLPHDIAGEWDIV